MPSRPPSRLHSHWVHDFVAKVHPRSEAPERFLYWGAVSAIAGALRRRVYIDHGTFKWYPNFYILLVGPPGLVKKSSTVDTALGILRRVEGVNFGSDCQTWESFVQDVAQAKDLFAVGGASGDLMEQEYQQTSALTFCISEFGTFFDPKNTTMINVMTEFWDGKDTAWKKNTKTQGSDTVVAPFINMIAGTTPEWLSSNFRHFGGWGLSARIIFLVCDKLEKYVPYPDEVWGDQLHTWQETFAIDLNTIAQMEGPIKLTPDARELGRAWYKENMDRVSAMAQTEHTDPWIAYYLSRKQIHIFKLAMVLSAAQGTSYTIDEPTLTEAIWRCDQVEDELGSIFGRTRRKSFAAELNMDVAKGIIAGIRQVGGACPEAAIFRFTYQRMGSREAKDLIDLMIRMETLVRHDTMKEIVLMEGPAGAHILPLPAAEQSPRNGANALQNGTGNPPRGGGWFAPG